MVTSEGDVEIRCCTGERASDIDVVDDSIGKSLQRLLYVQHKAGEVRSTGEENNRFSGKSLIKFALESERKGLSVESAEQGVLGVEDNFLDLVLGRVGEVRSQIHHVSAMVTQSLGAIHVAIASVAIATAGLGVVPQQVVERVRFLRVEVSMLKILRNSSVGEILDVHAATMARAIVGARRALARLALIARKAFALTRIAVANTAVSALGILVEASHLVRGVHPSELERADSFRTITGQMRKAYAPIIETLAHAVFGAGSMTRATIITGCLRDSQDGQEGQNRSQHYVLAVFY